jgi:hypothetical protein
VEAQHGEPFTLSADQKTPVLDGNDGPKYAGHAVAKRPAARMKLYETVAALSLVENWIDEFLTENPAMEGALSQPLEELLAQAEMDLAAKVGNIALLWKTLQLEAEFLKSEASRLTARRASREALVVRLKDFVKGAMLAAEKVSIKDPRVTVSVRVLADKLELAEGFDPAALPETFRITKYEPNMAAVKEYYEKHNRCPEGFTVEVDRYSVQAR